MTGEHTGSSKNRLIPVAAGVLLAAAYLILCAGVDPERILPGTAVNGVELGGMTLDEAVEALHEDADSKRNGAVLTISFEGERYRADVSDAVVFDCEGAAEAALRPSGGNFFLRGFAWLRAACAGSEQVLRPEADPERLREALRASGILGRDSTVQTTCQVEEEQLVFQMGRSGNAVDTDRLLEDAARAVREEDYENVLTAPVRAGTVEPVDLDAVYRTIHTDAVNATLDPEQDYQIVPSVTGVDFDREAARERLRQAEEGSTVSIDLIRTEPEITTADMEEHLFEEELSSFTTRVSSSADYIHNVRLAAEKCDGIILLPGEEFSFNQTVGEQTAETGFRKSSAIQGTKLIQAYGGGICQVSSVLFQAALYAGLDIPERWNHVYVTSYLAAGLDAAVAWDVQDFKIANNREYPVRLEVHYADRYLTASIRGTRTEDTRVEITTKVQESTDEILRVATYRKTYSADNEHFYLERIADSTYLSPRTRVD